MAKLNKIKKIQNEIKDIGLVFLCTDRARMVDKDLFLYGMRLEKTQEM